MLCVVLLGVIMMKVMAPFHGMLCNILFLHLTLTRLRQRHAFYNGTANFKNVNNNFNTNIYSYLTLKNVNNCLNTYVSSYLETSGGQIYNLYLNVVHFFNTIKLLWQLKTVVFLHWCLICTVLLCIFFQNVNTPLELFPANWDKV